MSKAVKTTAASAVLLGIGLVGGMALQQATIAPRNTITLPACATEDSNNCYWNARAHGNGQGRSFITYHGVTYLATLTFPQCEGQGSTSFCHVPNGTGEWLFNLDSHGTITATYQQVTK